MLLNSFSIFCKKIISNNRAIHVCPLYLNKYEHPLKRTIRILKNDLKMLVETPQKRATALSSLFPNHVDILIIGGAAVGSSIAYFLKEKTGLNGLNIAVIEKDTTYAKCSTTLSVGGLRQQFSLPENIQMSLYGAEFIRSLKGRFGPEAEVFFTPNGYLMLATENGAQQLWDNSKLQKELGAINAILNQSQLKERFPWLDVTDVELGCLGLENEGWFDPWAMLHILKTGAQEMGAQFITGEVVEFVFGEQHDILIEGIVQGTYQGINEANIKLPNDEIKSIKFSHCIIAAGAESGKVAELAKIGTGSGILTVPLPVEKRKRYVFCFNCKENAPGLNMPMTIDYTGTYVRRDGLGGAFVCGLSPLPEEEPDTSNLDVDHQFFDEKIWPTLANRIPVFNNIKLKNAWSGFYDYNTYDRNGIVGPHPYYHNLYIASGFSGHGIQQAPAVGRAIAEHILDGKYQTIDLTRLGFDRLLVDKPMFEVNIV